MATTSIFALLAVLTATTVAASNGVLSLGDYENCIGTELNTDIAADMCTKLHESRANKTSIGRSICIRTTRCRMIGLWGIEGKPEDGIHIPSPCILPVNATQDDELKCAKNFTGRAHSEYSRCADTVEAACAVISNVAIYKVASGTQKTVDAMHVGYLSMKDTIDGLNGTLSNTSQAMQEGFNSTNSKLDAAVLVITGNIAEAAGKIMEHTVVLTRFEWYFNIACGMIGMICFTLVAFAYFWRRQEQRQRRIDQYTFASEFMRALETTDCTFIKDFKDAVRNAIEKDLNDDKGGLKSHITYIAREAVQAAVPAPGPAVVRGTMYRPTRSSAR